MIANQSFGVHGCGSKANLYCILRDRRKKIENRFGSQNTLKNTGLRAGTIHKQLRQQM